MMNLRYILSLYILLFGASAAAAENSAGIDAVAFVTGDWEGPLFGGQAEESWMPPREGTMLGLFRLTWPGSERKVYEMFVIEEDDDGGVAMHFRHFSPGMKLWEDEIDAPISFRLVDAGPGRAVFEAADSTQRPYRFVFTSQDAGAGLTITVSSPGKDGGPEESFDAKYSRQGD